MTQIDMRACNDLSVDWTLIRNGLADARRDSGHHSVPEFAEKIAVDKTTVYRIEQHASIPAWPTIDRWLDATTKESIGQFLTRLEKFSAVNSSVTASGDTVSEPQPPRSVGNGSVVTEDRAVLAALDSLDDPALLERLALVFLRARALILRDERLRRADAEEPDRSGGSADAGGSVTPNLSIVK
jgi:hypothetical protein